MKRIRVTIEIDMPEKFRLSQIKLAAAGRAIADNGNGKLVYLATEEVANHWSMLGKEGK